MSIRLRLSISLPILLGMLVVNLGYGQDCEKLKDGKYKVKFKEKYGGAKYVILIAGDAFTSVSSGQESKGKIEVNENCTLVLDYLVEPDSTNAVTQVFSKSSKPYYEFEKTGERKLKFRLTGYGGPHTTAGEGHFVRIQ